MCMNGDELLGALYNFPVRAAAAPQSDTGARTQSPAQRSRDAFTRNGTYCRLPRVASRPAALIRLSVNWTGGRRIVKRGSGHNSKGSKVIASNHGSVYELRPIRRDQRRIR